MEAAKAERWRYEEASQRSRHERQPPTPYTGRWGDYRSRSLDLRQLPVTTVGSIRLVRHRVIGDAHGVSSEHSQAGVLCASVPHLQGGSGHPARTGCASSALETASAPSRPSVSDSRPTHQASCVSLQPGESCACFKDQASCVSPQPGESCVCAQEEASGDDPWQEASGDDPWQKASGDGAQ